MRRPVDPYEADGRHLRLPRDLLRGDHLAVYPDRGGRQPAHDHLRVCVVEHGVSRRRGEGGGGRRHEPPSFRTQLALD